ncbi:putative protamine p1 protein [Botrytis fragariae]|uniref:Putative protamine p1 protein n=1 Tax=Botrytis fragariae TaxID=1964551 RepID=A0A8H6AMT7_9HELO|nr:putative protamine p1 protein [Botrytis fragariae]KAF5870442.1 putative protamine p1 protein [Botrytis fragariae]
MSLHMSRSSLTSDNDDEPFYFTPAYKPEDLICEGSDSEANPRAIIKKRQQYEQCAERVDRGQLPIIQSAQLRGPLNEKEDVMRRAREHGRNDMSPTEALAWCRRDAKRQAKEMEMNDYMETGSEPSSGPNRTLVDETIHEDITMGKEGRMAEGKPIIRPSLLQVPKSSIPTPGQLRGSEDAPITGSSILNKDGYGRRSETWTAVKRPMEVAWLKGSHVSKRARWEDPAVSSPTPLPHVDSEKLQQKATGTTTVIQKRTQHAIHPQSDFFPEAKQQRLATPESYASLQQPSNDAFDTEVSFHTNIGQQGQQLRSSSILESCSKYPHMYENSPGLSSPVPFESPDSKEACARQPSPTKSDTSPRLPSHPRIGAVLHENQQTPGNISFVTDVAPSSVNLEQFQFRKKSKRKTVSPEVPSQPITVRGEGSEVSLSEENRSNPNPQSDAMLSTPLVLHSTEKAEATSVSPPKRINSSRSKGSSRRTSRADESWLTTQEEVRLTPSTMHSDKTIRGEYRPQNEDIDDSWVTTQDDLNHAPKSSASMDITQIYQSSIFLRRSVPLEHTEAPMFGDYEYKSSLQSSRLGNPSPARSTRPVSTSSPHLPTLSKISSQIDLPTPYKSLDGSSTQSYITSPAKSIMNTYESSQAPDPTQNLEDNQQSPHVIVTTLNSEVSGITREDNLQYSTLERVQRLDANKEVEKEGVASAINIAHESEQIKEVTELQANQVSNIDVIAASEKIQDEGDMQGVAQDMPEEVQEAMRTEADADDALNSVLSSGQTSTSSSPARTNNLTSSQKTRSINQNSKSIMSDQFASLIPSGDEVHSPASNHDLTESLAVGEDVVVIPPEDNEPVKAPIFSLRSEDQMIVQNDSPQSPWAQAEVGLIIAPQLLATTEIIEPQTNAEFPNSGWQREERPVTPDNDIIRPFRDLMTPSPPPEEPNTPEIDQRPSNTQLLVEAATLNPWVNDSKKKSAKRKRVSFGLLDEEDPSQSQCNSQRQRRSPSPESSYRPGDLGSKRAEFDDNITNIDSFQNHFSAIRRKSVGDSTPRFNSTIQRPSSIAKYKSTLSGATNLVASSPAIDAMAEAFISADRHSSRERERRLTLSPSRSRKARSQSYTTFEDVDEGDLGSQVSNSCLSTHTALNETSSNAKLGDHILGDFLNEAEDFLGGGWSVEGEMNKASTDFELATPKRDNGLHSRGIFSVEKIWT